MTATADQKTCFCLLEWQAIRDAARQALPRHWAVAGWKHAQLSHVEQEGVRPYPKDRGAEQGDVDGPLECSLALARVAADTRTSIAKQQRNETLPWCTDDQSAIVEARAEHDLRMQESSAFESTQVEGAGVRIDPWHRIQKNGGIVDFWYLDDGDILCDPRLVVPYLEAFDAANKTVGAERNVKKTEVIYLALQEELDQHGLNWCLHRVAELATISLASAGSPPLA
jgi:hypothetical protein